MGTRYNNLESHTHHHLGHDCVFLEKRRYVPIHIDNGSLLDIKNKIPEAKVTHTHEMTDI